MGLGSYATIPTPQPRVLPPNGGHTPAPAGVNPYKIAVKTPSPRVTPRRQMTDVKNLTEVTPRPRGSTPRGTLPREPSEGHPAPAGVNPRGVPLQS